MDFVPDDVSLGENIEYALPATNDYQRKMRDGSSVIKNHSITIHKEQTKQIIAMVPDGGNYKDLESDFGKDAIDQIVIGEMKSDV